MSVPIIMTICILLYENSDYIKSWVCFSSSEGASLHWFHVIFTNKGRHYWCLSEKLSSKPTPWNLKLIWSKYPTLEAIPTHFITISLMVLEELHLIFPLNLIFQNQLILNSNFSSSGPLILFLIRLLNHSTSSRSSSWSFLEKSFLWKKKLNEYKCINVNMPSRLMLFLCTCSAKCIPDKQNEKHLHFLQCMSFLPSPALLEPLGTS